MKKDMMFQELNKKEKIKKERITMRRSIYLFALLSLFVVGCSEQSSVIAPVNNVSTNEPNWIVSLSSNDLAVNTVHSASVLIDGAKGGSVEIRKDVPGGPFGKIQIDSRLVIRAGSFLGKMTITTNVDDAAFLTTFGPSYVFNRPLEYTFMLQGLNLSGVNLTNLRFVYQAADGSIEQCQYSSIDVDVNKGKIKVNSALIPHFSRYGFVN
jgi:hypothetical protein